MAAVYCSNRAYDLSYQEKMVLNLVLGARQTAAKQALFFTWDHLRFLNAVDDLNRKVGQVVMLVRMTHLSCLSALSHNFCILSKIQEASNIFIVIR